MQKTGNVMAHQDLTVLVVGTGSIANRHIVNLLALGVDVCFHTTNVSRLTTIASTYGITGYDDYMAALDHSDAVIIANPTDLHHLYALPALRLNKSIFLEKPISHDLGFAMEIYDNSHGHIIEVGCQFRASKNLQHLKLLLSQGLFTYYYNVSMGLRLDQWRPSRDYKNSYSAQRCRGGGALFDLIHTIDSAIWLFGDVVTATGQSRNSNTLMIDADEVTLLSLSHANSVIGQIQNDMVSPYYRGGIELITTDDIYYYSIPKCQLFKRFNSNQDLINISPDPSESRDALFLSHMQYFLRRITTPSLPPLCSIDDAIKALKVIQNITSG